MERTVVPASRQSTCAELLSPIRTAWGAATGELTLSSPIGSTLAQLHWAPGEALLKDGTETRRFDSVDALVEAATGAAIPVSALFAWLAGRDERVPGWRPDLSKIGTGRLQATRESPQPRADLRIVFERA